jgi:hypothetical protein
VNQPRPEQPFWGLQQSEEELSEEDYSWDWQAPPSPSACSFDPEAISPSAQAARESAFLQADRDDDHNETHSTAPR